jgi:predicted Zn finger-like uncharacterized protein
MKIVCDSCGAKYSIADEKVAGKIFKIRCKKCSSVLEVRGDRTGANAVEDPKAGQPSAGEATWYIVVDGEQKGPLAPIDLSQLFAKGSVNLGSYVWAEGFDDWKVASEVPELAQLFGGGTSQPGTGGGADSTAAFAAGGDLFGGGDREPTAEIDTSSSMFAEFEDNPTPAPTAANESPLAAAAQAAGESLAGGAMGGGAAAASGAQRMTGQRNENSVLFSLSNLQQLASRGGATAEAAPAAKQAPAATASPQGAPPATGEGSGLIDIRALARSAGPGNAAAPSQAVDDLLAIGTGGGAALGGPLLGPAPDDTSEGNRWLWIGGVAIAVIAIIGAGVWVGTVVGGSEDDALEITAEAGTAPSEASPGSSAVAAATASPTEAPSEPFAAAQPAEIVAIEDNPPDEAPQLKDPAPAKRASATTQRRPRTSKSTRSTSPKSAPAPAPKKRSGNNLDALMDEVVGGSSSSSKPKARSTSTASSSNLPDSPSRNDVKTALQGVSGAVKACRKDAGGTATVDVTFSGKTGRATGARVTSGPFKGTPVGTCIQTAVKRARVPRFKQSSFKVTFPYRL